MTDIAHVQWGIGWRGGVLVANPIPADHELPHADIDAAIDDALAEAKVQGIHGKEITPFLLSEVERRTAGRSLQANIRLIEHNARVGAQIAKAYAAHE